MRCEAPYLCREMSYENLSKIDRVFLLFSFLVFSSFAETTWHSLIRRSASFSQCRHYAAAAGGFQGSWGALLSISLLVTGTDESSYHWSLLDPIVNSHFARSCMIASFKESKPSRTICGWKKQGMTLEISLFMDASSQTTWTNKTNLPSREHARTGPKHGP